VSFDGFSKDFFKFFRELERNNERAWFEANKDRYKSVVVAPLSDFIADLAPLLAKASPHFRADPRPNGGSMFRIYRDVRFSRDKSPYKTHASAQFRHELGKDVHAPGYYLHLAPGEVFFGGGLWMPDPPTLARIRTRIADRPGEWRKAKAARTVQATYGDLRDGDPLTRPPKGFDPDHPMIEDIKMRSFFVSRDSDEAEAASPAFVKFVGKSFADAAPVMKFLCEAVGANY
jgi:uncharacterized protein (TIGR02453 family)